MNYFPGLTVRAPDNRPDMASELLDALFLSGGLYLSQVSRLTGLAYYEVQNWVKRKFLTQPVHKTYSRRQFCRIVLINHLREGMQIESIAKLLEHINGHLDDESDDLIDDAGLYNYYVNTLIAVGDRLLPEEELRKIIAETTSSYVETVPGSRQRLKDVLTVMVYTGFSVMLKERCSDIMSTWIPKNGTMSGREEDAHA